MKHNCNIQTVDPYTYLRILARPSQKASYALEPNEIQSPQKLLTMYSCLLLYYTLSSWYDYNIEEPLYQEYVIHTIMYS